MEQKVLLDLHIWQWPKRCHIALWYDSGNNNSWEEQQQHPMWRVNTHTHTHTHMRSNGKRWSALFLIKINRSMRRLFGCGNWLPPMIELPRACLVRGENLELAPQGKFAIDERQQNKLRRHIEISIHMFTNSQRTWVAASRSENSFRYPANIKFHFKTSLFFLFLLLLSH